MLGLSVFGETFVGQKLVFVPILAGYIYFAAALVNRAQTKGSLKALLFLAFFFAGIHFEAYRFDDYHVFENMLTMAVVKFSLDYLDSDPRHPWVTSISIGICLALALLTRINDGLAVFLVVSFYYMRGVTPAARNIMWRCLAPCCVPRHRFSRPSVKHRLRGRRPRSQVALLPRVEV